MDRPSTSSTATAVAEPRRHETGLLTRWVPERLKHTAAYRWFLRLARVLQFLSSAISLGIFSQRLAKVYRLVNSIKTRRGINGAYGAVEGILAAAVAYTLAAMVMSLVLRGGGPRWLRWLWVLLDLAFVGAFIAVAVLTSPDGGMAGPRHCYDGRDLADLGTYTGETADAEDDSCNLPWGTFVLAIVSTVLHAITAAFHEVRDRYRAHRGEKYAGNGHAHMNTGPGQSQAHHAMNGSTGYQHGYGQPQGGYGQTRV